VILASLANTSKRSSENASASPSACTPSSRRREPAGTVAAARPKSRLWSTGTVAAPAPRPGPAASQSAQPAKIHRFQFERIKVLLRKSAGRPSRFGPSTSYIPLDAS
jgi:hypothetical protein